MDNRNRTPGGQHDYRDRYGSRERQSEQFSSGSEWQQGDDRWGGQNSQSSQRWGSDDRFDRGYDRNENTQREDFTRAGSGYRGDTSSLDDYDRSAGSRYGGGGMPRGSYGSGSGYDIGRSSTSRNTTGYGSDSYGSNSFGSGSYGGHIPPRQYDRDDRGFFDRASDEVMSWFGDDDASRRREMDHREDHRGKGPAGYTRSKERIIEDANERLMHDSSVDASNITVACEDNEITLSGTVNSRSAKRRAEDIVDNVSGVKHVQNNLRVETRDSYYGTSPSGTASES